MVAGSRSWPVRAAPDPSDPRGYHAAMPDPTERTPSFDTLAVHAGAEPDELTGAVSPPIYQTSTFRQDGVGRPRGGYDYARSVNPTRERLERAVAALEGGTHGIAFSSGSAATAAIAELAAPGDEIVVGDDVYGGTYRYLERVRRPGAGVEPRFVDLAAGPDELWEALNERTRLVWFETPTNPLLKVVDIRAMADALDRRAPPRADDGRSSSSTTRSPRRPSSSRSRSARTSCSTRRPSTCPGTRTRSSGSP